MTCTIVVNVYVDEYDVDIRRGTPFGNPYSCELGTRAAVIVDSKFEAIDRYAKWLTSDLKIPGWPKPTKDQIASLFGKRLGCVCAPRPCHGDVLVKLAEEPVLALLLAPEGK